MVTDLTGRIFPEMKMFVRGIIVMVIIMQDLYPLDVTECYQQEICYEPV
jgi:hypothetical protein